MTDPSQPCQVPSKQASRFGDSGMDPPEFGEHLFVADQGDALDVPHPVNAGTPVVTACIETTRYVGTVDSDGFLVNAAGQVEGGVLAETLVLTVRGLIGALDAGGLLGVDGLDVEVVLHRGTAHEVSLGLMEGSFLGNWENYTIDVPIGALCWPADPCPGLEPTTSCGRESVPRPNEVSFVFSGRALAGAGRMTFTIDWLALQPKVGLEVAARPVLLVHGWFGGADTWDDSVWIDAFRIQEMPFQVIVLPPNGRVVANGAEVSVATRDLAERFGAERITIVSHSKGGVDSRQHVRAHDDVELLVMIATPNAGTPLATYPAKLPFAGGVKDLTPAAMQNYNQTYRPNPVTTFAAASGAYDSARANRFALWVGPNDEFIAVDSVEALPYARPFSYITSIHDAESTGICATKRLLLNHSCLLFRGEIVDEIFPIFLTLPASRAPGLLAAAQAARPSVRQSSVGFREKLQFISSAAGQIAAGASDSHAVLVDALLDVLFQVAGDPAGFAVTLVSPSGTRFDASSQDPSVQFLVIPDEGPMSMVLVDVDRPEAGQWTVEVTGAAVAPGIAAAEESPEPYVVAAMTSLVPGVGVTLDAVLERTLLGAGEAITMVATLTQDGVPVTNADVRALLVLPDGTETEIALRDDGLLGDAVADDGVYTALFADTSVAGSYDITVLAARSDPGFTREQALQAVVTLSSSAFSATVTDRGVDTNGDGFFDQLVVDVGLNIDTAAGYRLSGTLTELDSAAAIEQVRVEAALEPGARSVALAFDGARLFERALDGPYVVTDLTLEDVASATVVALGAPHTTEAYRHDQFQRPACVLTGNTSDRGDNAANKPLAPFEELVVEVEVDLLTPAQIEANARLRGSDGTLIDVRGVHTQLTAGPSLLGFRFQASRIFRSALPGPYTLGELTLTGVPDDPESPVLPFSLSVPGAVAVTQPYALEDFAPSPTFTVGGTVTGLVGFGLVLELVGGTFPTPLRITRNGAFTFAFTQLFGGNPYEVRVKTQPSNPAQVCTVINGTGTITAANVTDVEVQCLPPATP